MCGSYELVPALECGPCLRMPVPKVDERVAGNDPHGALYHVPNLGTSFTPFATKLGFIPAEKAKADNVTTALTDQSLVEKTPQINKSASLYSPNRVAFVTAIISGTLLPALRPAERSEPRLAGRHCRRTCC
jgi:hypothetical protein